MEESFYEQEDKRRLIRHAEKHFRLIGAGRAAIDDKTWSDLSGDEFYHRICACSSSPGRSVLYARMRSPSLDPITIEKRQRDHEERTSSPSDLRGIRKVLASLGFSRDSCLREYLDALRPLKGKHSEMVYPLIAAISVLCYLSPLLIGLRAGLVLVIAALSASVAIYVSFKKKTVSESERIFYVAKLIRAANRLSKEKVVHFADERFRLGNLADKLSGLGRRCSFFFKPMGVTADLMDSLAEFIKMVLLLEAINYSYARSGCLRERESLYEIFDLIGGIDASLSVSDYLDRQGRKAKMTLQADPGVHASDMIHPLLARPVPNSISIAQRGVIITGTNMSGKSTFLRALGLNLILADLSGYALAEAFSASPLYPVSAINDTDDVLRGKSRYLGEAERLLEFIRLRDSGQGQLFLIDEILSGTNSTERTLAATEILRYLAKRGALTVAATHDLSIAAELDGTYDNYHFDDEVTESGLVFDYRIKSGIVTKRNALKLLAFLGYPKEIVDRLIPQDAK